MLSPRFDTAWEVVEHKEIAQVPTYFDDTEMDITSISPHDISQTFTFDRPVWYNASKGRSAASSSASSPPSPSSRRLRLCPKSIFRRKTLYRSGSSSPSTHTRSSFSLPRSSSDVSSEGDDSDSDLSFGVGSTSRSSIPHDFTSNELREALVFARAQLINSTAFKDLGGNVLFFEGWEVTKLRKGSQHRLQIRYTGRPARALYYTLPSPSLPPFLGVLGDR